MSTPIRSLRGRGIAEAIWGFVFWSVIAVFGCLVAIVAIGIAVSDKPRPAPAAALAATPTAPAKVDAATKPSPPEQPTAPTWDEMEKLNGRLDRHDRSVLSMIPAKGYRDGVAGVLRDYRLYVNVNSEIYFRGVPLPDKNLPVGYYFSLFICRMHKSNHYDELDGVHAVWFRANGQSSFVPWNAWARHISDHDSWIEVGGPIDETDSEQRASRAIRSRSPEEAARAAAHAVLGK